jgi:hypothetical protein
MTLRNKNVAICVWVGVCMLCGCASDDGTSTLQLRPVIPSQSTIQGEPLTSVQVEMEILNPTQQPVTISPLSMPCSCQIAKAPSTTIPAQGKERFTVEFRLPPFGSKFENVIIKNDAGAPLLQSVVKLESVKPPPYFTKLPSVFELSRIKSVADSDWEFSLMAWEEVEQPPYLASVRIQPMAGPLAVEATHNDSCPPHSNQALRTYTLKFHMQDQTDVQEGPPPSDVVVLLELTDNTVLRIPLNFHIQEPLAFVFNKQSGTLRGVRRAGASGRVHIAPIPSDAGHLVPERFDSESAIISQFQKSNSNLEGIEAIFESPTGNLPVSIRFRRD